MQIIDGKKIATVLRGELKEKVTKFPRDIGLAVIIVGNDPASEIYVRNKIRACEEVGIRSFSYRLSADCGQAALENLLDELAANADVHGILLQLPLPSGFDEQSALNKIPVSKDVDGFKAENLGRILTKEQGAIPCTPYGVMKLLEYTGVELQGKRAVVIGRSNTVGKPLALLLLNANATVTVCHSKTENLTSICREADILVSAVGKANLVKADMVKEGAVVIDVGINRDGNGKLCGDVDFENVKEKAEWITPVPGGVGPMTITMLLWNTYQAALSEIINDV